MPAMKICVCWSCCAPHTTLGMARASRASHVQGCPADPSTKAQIVARSARLVEGRGGRSVGVIVRSSPGRQAPRRSKQAFGSHSTGPGGCGPTQHQSPLAVRPRVAYSDGSVTKGRMGRPVEAQGGFVAVVPACSPARAPRPHLIIARAAARPSPGGAAQMGGTYDAA
jgi:hypothetical protein